MLVCCHFVSRFSRHNKVAEYGAALGRNGTLEDYAAVAAHFEAAGDWGNAGRYCVKAERWAPAVTAGLRCGTSEGIQIAIDAVRAAHEREDPTYAQLAKTIHDHILHISSANASTGAGAGTPGASASDMRLVLQLYFAIGEHHQVRLESREEENSPPNVMYLNQITR